MKLHLNKVLRAALVAAITVVGTTLPQTQAKVLSSDTTNQVTVAGTPYTSSAADGVRVVFGDNEDNTSFSLGEDVTAQYTFITSSDKGTTPNKGRYLIDADAASRMANYGTLILAEGVVGQTSYKGGQIFLRSGVTITNNLILGTCGYEEGQGWAGSIRMGGNNTFSGHVDIVQDTTLVMGGTATFSGSVSGENASVTLMKNNQLTFTNGGNVNIGRVILQEADMEVKQTAQDQTTRGTLYTGTVEVKGGRTLTLTPASTDNVTNRTQAPTFHGDVILNGTSSSKSKILYTDGSTYIDGAVDMGTGAYGRMEINWDKQQHINALKGTNATLELARNNNSGGKGGYFNLYAAGGVTGTVKLQNQAQDLRSGLIVHDAPTAVEGAVVDFSTGNKALLAFVSGEGTYDSDKLLTDNNEWTNGTVAGMTGSHGSVKAATLTINTAADTAYSYGGDLGVSSLVKEGAGSQAISTAVSVTGGVNVKGGTLDLGGNLTAATLSVAEDATLKLDGTISTATADSSIGVTGTLTLTGNVVFNLTNFTHTSGTGAGTYTIFTGSTVDLSGYGFSVSNITGFTGVGQATDYGWIFGKDGTISYSTAVEYDWAGTANTWVDGGEGWLKNSEPVTYVSAPTSSARFGASSEAGFVKDIAVNTAVEAHDMIVNDAYTFTLGNGGSIAASSIAVDGEGASLTVNGTGTVTTMGISASGKTITVGSGILLQGGTADAFNLDGSGTYALGSGAAALGNVTLADSWNGALKFSNVTGFNGINLDAYGHTAAVELDNVSGYLYSPTNGSPHTFNTKMVLGAGGLTLVNGNSNYAHKFVGGVEGTGDLKVTLASGSNSPAYHFNGSVQGWTGNFILDGNKTVTLVFEGQATTVNAGIQRNQGTLNVNVGDGTNAFTATFHKAMSASALTVKAQATATFEEEVSLAGDINLNGNSTATFNKAVRAANMRLGDNSNPYTGATATFNGALTLTGDLTVNGSADKVSNVLLNEGGSVSVIDLSHGGNSHGTVTVAAGKNLTYSSSFWGANNNKLILEEGASVQKESSAPVIIKGLKDGGYVSSSANDLLGLDKSCYTLSNVEATIKEASDNVQLRFDNSKLVTDRNITLKNLQSVFSCMDIQGGTTTVGTSVATDITVQLGAVALSSGNLTLAQHVIGGVSGISVSGTSSITGGTLKLGRDAVVSLNESAELSLSSVNMDLSAKELQDGSTGYKDGQNDGNGFAFTSGKVQLVDFGDGSTLATDEGTTFMHGVNSGTLVTEDGADKGYVIFNDTSYTAFFVNVAGKEESLSAALAKAGEHSVFFLTDVYLNAGTLNTTGVDSPVGALHVNSGDGTAYLIGNEDGGFATLDGRGALNTAIDLNGTNLSIAAGDSLALNGGTTITYSNVSNRGTLAIGSDTTVRTSGDITVNGGTSTISGDGHFISNAKLTVDDGMVKLTAANVQFAAIDLGNGALNIAAGTTTVEGNVVLGYGNGKASGTIIVANGAILTAQNVTSPWGFSTLTVDGIINATNQFSITTGNQIRNVTGSGIINTANLVVGNQTTRAVFSDGLTINIGNGGITGSNGVRPLELHNVTVGVLGDSTGWSAANAIALADTSTGTTFNIGSDKVVTLNGVVSEIGKLVKADAGTVILTAANTYSGGTTINAGKVVTTSATALGTGDVNIANGATLEMQANLTIAGNLTGTGDITYTGNEAGTLSLTKAEHQNLAMDISAVGAGKLNLSLNGSKDYKFSGDVDVNTINHATSSTVFVVNNGDVTAAGKVLTGRVVVGESSTETRAVFTLSGTDAMLVTSGDATEHTYGNKVQGYGTFKLEGGATQTLTGDLTGDIGFQGTFWADGADSTLTLQSTIADNVTLKATNGGEIILKSAAKKAEVDNGTFDLQANVETLNVSGESNTLDMNGGSVANINLGGNLTANGDLTIHSGNTGTVVNAEAGKKLAVLGTANVDERVKFSAAQGKTVDVTNTGDNKAEYSLENDKMNVQAHTLEVIDNENGVTISNLLVVDEIVNTRGQVLTLDNVGDTLELLNMNITNSTAQVYTNLAKDTEATVSISDTLTAGGGTLLANLTMADGSTLDVKGGNTMALTLGSQFTIANGALVNLDGDTLAAIAGLENIGDKVILIKQYGDHELTTNLADGDWARAHFDLSSITDADYKMYVQDGQIGLVKSSMVPEPTTGTLSLLALMALAARRRRH